MKKLLLSLGLLWVCSLGILPLSDAAAKAPRAKVSTVSGQVNLNGTQAFVGDAVPDGAVVETGKNSFCAVVFDDRNAVSIGAETRLTLSLDGPQKTIDIVKGVVASLVRRLARVRVGKSYPYTVKTPTAICGVRGTAFFVKVEGPNRTYVCLCNGRLDLSGAAGGKVEHLSAAHHQAFFVDRKGASVIMSQAPMSFHTDGDMEALGTLIGERLHWSAP